MNAAYHEKLGEDNIAELNAGKGITQRCSAKCRNERMKGRITVDYICIIVSRQQWQQTQQIGHV